MIRVLALALLINVQACSLTRGSDLERRDAVQIAYQYLETEKSILDPEQELAVRKVTTDDLGLTHIKLDHLIKNVPVWGEDFIVHLDKKLRVYRVDGKFTDGLRNLKTTPQLDVKAAQSYVQKEFPGWNIKSSRLIIVADVTPPLLSYDIQLEKNFNTQQIFLDADTGKIIKRLGGVTLD